MLIRLVLSESVKGTFPYTLKDRLRDEIFNEEGNKKQYFESITRQDLDEFLHLGRVEKKYNGSTVK